jgi:hypothetical protein
MIVSYIINTINCNKSFYTNIITYKFNIKFLIFMIAVI